MNLRRRAIFFLCVLATPLLLTAALLIALGAGSAKASSHREAPLIGMDPYADNTDTYVWIPQGQTENIVLAANWIPLEAPEGGPNYYAFDDRVEYKIYVDNDGDAAPNITYTLKSRTEILNPNTFLYNTGPIDDLGDTDWNYRQYYTVTETMDDGTSTVLVDNEPAPPVNIGSKSTPNYGMLASQAIYPVTTAEGDGAIFAGQRDDPFWVDLQVFDLLTLRGQAPPIGYSTGNNEPVDSLAGLNVHSLIIELPIAHLTNDYEPVLGVWATAGRVAPTVLNSTSAPAAPDAHSQISRLGMPLVNEVVIPLGLKDTFNTLAPSSDLSVYGLLQESVEDPEVGNLLCALYGVPLPGDSDDDCDTEYTAGTPRTGRGDIFDIFLTGMVLANPFTINTASGPVELPAGFNVNQPADVQPAEMLRINTEISGDTCSPTPSRLGVLGGDACGYPNGRRPADDAVEISLLAVAGAAYEVLDDRDDSFTFNPALIDVLDDGVDFNDVPFLSAFPYFSIAQSGQEHFHENGNAMPTGLSFGSVTLTTGSAPWVQLLIGAASLGLVGGFEMLRRRRRAH